MYECLIWVGTVTDHDEFAQYLEEQFEDDDAPMNQFAADQGVEFYDHDTVELDVRDKNLTPEEMLSMFSYSPSFIDEALGICKEKEITEINTVIIFFEAEDIPEPKSIKKDNINLEFLGHVSYSRDA